MLNSEKLLIDIFFDKVCNNKFCFFLEFWWINRFSVFVAQINVKSPPPSPSVIWGQFFISGEFIPLQIYAHTSASHQTLKGKQKGCNFCLIPFDYLWVLWRWCAKPAVISLEEEDKIEPFLGGRLKNGAQTTHLLKPSSY